MRDAASHIQAVHNSQCSAESLVREALARIDVRQNLAAWVCVDRDGALADARRLDAMVASGAALPPLAGLTVGVKDVFAVRKLPRRAGSVLSDHTPQSRDAALVARLREAGALILGTTSMPEFALGITPGARNPHNPLHTPGSSSSGSAIAVADGQVALALGTQTNASIIRPASFCGIAAFKPSQGSLPLEGILPLVPSLDQPGFMAKDLEGLRIVYAALCGFQEKTDPTRPVALVRTAKWEEATPGTRAAIEALALTLQAEALILPREFDLAWQWLDRIMDKELAVSLTHLKNREADLTPPLRQAVARGEACSRAAYQEALEGQKELQTWGEKHLAFYDCLLTPAATGPAPLLEQGAGSPVFSTLWSLMGAPCLTLPLRREQGLPVGVQLVAAPGHDQRLLVAGKRIQAALMELTFESI